MAAILYKSVTALSRLFFCPIFFKFAHDVAYIRGVFAIENQQDRLITSGDREYFV